jgi:DNA-directed RNA polymerase specialized sigma24 family protein
LPEGIALLPPPYRQAAELQLLHGASRREIQESLAQWRPVSAERVHAILRQGHEMLRSWLRGEDPKTRWAHCYTKKNPWTSTPPAEI